MITWPFLVPLQSDHLCCFRTEWGTFLQSSWKKWSLEPGVADLCLRSRQQSKVSHGWRNARLGEVSTGVPWFPWSSAKNSSLMASLSHLWKVLVLPDQRVTCDYISCRGQLLLIFNTKSQGNGEERLHYYHRCRGMVELSTSTSQLANAFCFSSLLELSKVLETFYFYFYFLSPEKWFGLQRDKCTEWHFIFWFLFSTEKPWGVGGHSSSWGNRNSLWPCFGKMACLVFYLPSQGTSKLRSAAQQARRPPRVHCQEKSFFEISKLDFGICWLK